MYEDNKSNFVYGIMWPWEPSLLSSDRPPMAHSKDRHYWSQLRLALTAGLWSSPTPAKTPKGQGLSWHELLRKFKKHVHGHDELASVASQTQLLALSLGKNVENSSSNQSPLDLGNESILPEDRRIDANAGLMTLKTLEKSNFNVRDILSVQQSSPTTKRSLCHFFWPTTLMQSTSLPNAFYTFQKLPT